MKKKIIFVVIVSILPIIAGYSVGAMYNASIEKSDEPLKSAIVEPQELNTEKKEQVVEEKSAPASVNVESIPIEDVTPPKPVAPTFSELMDRHGISKYEHTASYVNSLKSNAPSLFNESNIEATFATIARTYGNTLVAGAPESRYLEKEVLISALLGVPN